MIPQQGFIITDGMKVTNRNGPILKRVALLFWSRSIGWYGAAIVDVLDFLPQETAGRDSIIQILQGLAKAIVKYQDPSSGTWYQVTDQGAREGNYLESSATALFIYTLAKAINKDILATNISNRHKKPLTEW